MGFQNRVIAVYGVVERIVIYVLLFMLTLVVFNATWIFSAEIISRLWQRMSGSPPDVASAAEFLHKFSIVRQWFGAFLLILIGVELMKTIIMYLKSHELHVEVVFTVAMIAIARHAIDVDIENSQPLTMMGMGAMILALALGYYYFRKAVTARSTVEESK